MAELHTNLYVHHPDPAVQQSIVELFSILDGWPEADTWNERTEKFIDTASGLNPHNGRQLAQKFIESNDPHDVTTEAAWEIEGYHAGHYVHGSNGDEVISGIIALIDDLCADVDVRANLVGDDDPWEIFFRLQDGEIRQQYYEPFEDEEADEEALDTGVYAWWHEGLPESIKEGFLNESYDDEDDDDDDEY